jgi:hypothetical protein
MTTPSYFHIERFRPGRLYLFLTGLVGLFAIAVAAPVGVPLILGLALCGGLLVAGAPAVLGGATWESWIYRGRVHWVRPGPLWGRSDSCPVEDVTELRPAASSTGRDAGTTHILILKDGTERAIDRRCVGDANAFLQALRKENPAIRSTTAKS